MLGSITQAEAEKKAKEKSEQREKEQMKQKKNEVWHVARPTDPKLQMHDGVLVIARWGPI